MEIMERLIVKGVGPGPFAVNCADQAARRYDRMRVHDISGATVRASHSHTGGKKLSDFKPLPEYNHERAKRRRSPSSSYLAEMLCRTHKVVRPYYVQERSTGSVAILRVDASFKASLVLFITRTQQRYLSTHVLQLLKRTLKSAAGSFVTFLNGSDRIRHQGTMFSERTQPMRGALRIMFEQAIQ